ncbi:hypothetical protein CRG98_003943 [Punica granatum]|uniref:Uncharacterized protein n=1 Tax=Punica granatum TaxID=22663 RepID=A0A2I0L4W6_PUNGR|nr:hypothetical protein CRG98_003943 [Punica granatum]
MIPSGVAKLCAPEFRLVGARLRAPKCNVSWECPPSRGRATDAREKESPLPVYDLKDEGRQLGLLGSGPNWADELDWADGGRIWPNWAGLDLYWTGLMETDWADLGWIRTGRAGLLKDRAGLLKDRAGPSHTVWIDPLPMLIRKKWEPIRLAGK